MGAVAHNLRDILRYQAVDLPMEYATQVLDKNQTGLITIQQISKDAVLMHLLVPSSVLLTFLRTNNAKVITNFLLDKFGNNTAKVGYVNIDKQLKP
ncbi:MAG: hypothetical protein WAZ77_18570, partial [Candidatus Nitrosopolaris sp.]